MPCFSFSVALVVGDAEAGTAATSRAGLEAVPQPANSATQAMPTAAAEVINARGEIAVDGFAP